MKYYNVKRYKGKCGYKYISRIIIKFRKTSNFQGFLLYNGNMKYGMLLRGTTEKKKGKLSVLSTQT